MKTYENKLDEMIDMVVKLTWNHTIFCALFEKKDVYREAREAHPQFFITMYDTLLCSFCVATMILFHKKKQSATSLCNLIKAIEVSKPELAKKLNRKISAQRNLIKKIGAVRNQVCAHRWDKKTPQEVFDEVVLQLKAMKEVTDLARLIICALAEEAGGNRREKLENLQLDKNTLQFITDDVDRVMNTFVETA